MKGDDGNVKNFVSLYPYLAYRRIVAYLVAYQTSDQKMKTVWDTWRNLSVLFFYATKMKGGK